MPLSFQRYFFQKLQSTSIKVTIILIRIVLKLLSELFICCCRWEVIRAFISVIVRGGGGGDCIDQLFVVRWNTSWSGFQGTTCAEPLHAKTNWLLSFRHKKRAEMVKSAQRNTFNDFLKTENAAAWKKKNETFLVCHLRGFCVLFFFCQLALSPSPRTPSEPIPVQSSQQLTLKVEGVVQHGSTPGLFRKIQSVCLNVTSVLQSKTGPDYKVGSLRQNQLYRCKSDLESWCFYHLFHKHIPGFYLSDCAGC